MPDKAYDHGDGDVAANCAWCHRARRLVRDLLMIGGMNVESVMSRNVKTCRSNQTALAALRVMRDNDIGCVPVVDHGTLVGMVTDRDIALAAAEEDKSPSELRISKIMSGDVVVAQPDMSLAEAEALMKEQQIRRLPVVDEDSRPIGILSLNDLAREGAAHGWKSSGDGITARNVAATLAAICQPGEFAARATG